MIEMGLVADTMVGDPFHTVSPLRSVLLTAAPSLLQHHGLEFIEEIARVVRSGRGFRVILHAERRKRLVAKSFQCLIVEIDVSDFDFGTGKRIDIDCKTVVLCGDLYLSRRYSQHRVIATAVSKF